MVGVFKVGRNKNYYFIACVYLPFVCLIKSYFSFVTLSWGEFCKQTYFYRKIKKAEVGRVKVVRICCDNLGLAYINEVIETS